MSTGWGRVDCAHLPPLIGGQSEILRSHQCTLHLHFRLAHSIVFGYHRNHALSGLGRITFPPGIANSDPRIQNRMLLRARRYVFLHTSLSDRDTEL